MDALAAHLPEIAVAAGLAWASGLRLYLVLLIVFLVLAAFLAVKLIGGLRALLRRWRGGSPPAARTS
ncbi:MAG: hypothetical protein ACOZDY_15255 [Pseudomonadota bacterium]